MAYISLYRKYRSQTFDDVIGQDHVVRTITNAIKAGRIGQGYLFCGSRGTGKTTVARLIAKALNCLSADGPIPEPCNECSACVDITNGNAVDVIEMDAASNRGVDDVDNLRDGVKYPPMSLRYKVYIIDEAHQLSPQAKDAFLKTLEEPPPHAVFILATTEANKIPITIRSRCQQFDFRRGTVHEITDRLKHVVTTEGAAIDDDAIDLIARAANGSYRDSLSLLEQVMAYTEGSITAKEVYTVLGMVDEDVLLELGEVLGGLDTAAAFGIADRLLREGRDVRELLKSGANHFRDLLALKVGADSRHSKDERWTEQARNYTQERLVRIIDVLTTAEKDLKWNEQHRLGLEMALLKSMIRPKETAATAAPAPPVAVPAAQPAPAPVARPEPRPEPKREPEPEAVPEPVAEPIAAAPVVEEPVPAPAVEEPVTEEPAAPASGQAVTLADVQKNWPKILMHLKKVLKGTSEEALARVGTPVTLRGSVMTLGFIKRNGFHRDGTERNAEKISQAIQDVLGVRLKVNTMIVEDDSSASGGGAPGEEQARTESAEHPHQNAVLTMFDGSVESDPGADPWGEE